MMTTEFGLFLAEERQRYLRSLAIPFRPPRMVRKARARAANILIRSGRILAEGDIALRPSPSSTTS